MASDTTRDPAGIQYMGASGSSRDCKNAVIRLIQFGDRLKHARVLTHSTEHAILLSTDIGDLIAIKSGFASGYAGEGPAAFSYVLALLESHQVDMDEVDVSEELMARLEQSALTNSDLEVVERAKLLHGRRLYDYISDRHWERAHSGAAWREFPPLIPFAIVDVRIADLARDFWADPDGRLLSAWRRLEDIVRERINSSDHGSKLFSAAFLGEKSVLVWHDIDTGEQVGRANVFIGSYAAYRNPRAHRELKHDAVQQLQEFLVVNQLFGWERNAVDRLDSE